MDQTRLSKYTAVKITLILGPPACGKGTLAKRLADKQNMYHLSVGDHLRSLCAETHPETAPAFGGMTKSTLKAALTAHELVPAENIIRVVWHKIGIEIDNGSNKFLVDGFPRDETAAWHFEQMLQKHSAEDIKAIISIDCPKDICKERFLNRRRENTDSGEVFEKRYKEFQDKTREVLKRYKMHMHYVSTTGSIEESERDLYKSLQLN